MAVARVPTLVALLAGVAAGALAARPGPVDAKGEVETTAAYFAPEGGIEKAVQTLIDGAQREVLVGMYLFTSRPLSEALVRAKRRGVSVRVILDETQRAGRYGKWSDLKHAGVDVRSIKLGRSKNGEDVKFHHKFVVVDGEQVETGSFNWTQLADDENWENAVVIRSRRLAAEFKEQFEKAWALAEAPALAPKSN